MITHWLNFVVLSLRIHCKQMCESEDRHLLSVSEKSKSKSTSKCLGQAHGVRLKVTGA